MDEFDTRQGTRHFRHRVHSQLVDNNSVPVADIGIWCVVGGTVASLLAALAELLLRIEQAGAWSLLKAITHVVCLPKPDGGWRPIPAVLPQSTGS